MRARPAGALRGGMQAQVGEAEQGGGGGSGAARGGDAGGEGEARSEAAAAQHSGSLPASHASL
jgi:hypothetical protein